MNTKYCQGCRRHHSSDEFGKRSDSKDGLQSYCRSHANTIMIKWARDNRERKSAQSRSYDARSNVSRIGRANTRVKRGPRLTVKGWAEVQERQNHQCNLCTKAPIEILDHVVPVSAGGSNRLHNIEGLCIPCNKLKTAGEWAGKALWKVREPRPIFPSPMERR